MLSVVAIPVVDLYAMWANLGLTLVGSDVAYILTEYDWTPGGIGIAGVFAWLVVQQPATGTPWVTSPIAEF